MACISDTVVLTDEIEGCPISDQGSKRRRTQRRLCSMSTIRPFLGEAWFRMLGSRCRPVELVWVWWRRARAYGATTHVSCRNLRDGGQDSTKLAILVSLKSVLTGGTDFGL